MLCGKKYNGILSDIWNCGIILYCMLIGHLPFTGSEEKIIYENIIKHNYKFPSYISKNAINLIENMLVIDPKKRYNFEKIKKHPWFNIIKPNFKPGIVNEVHKIPVDFDIINKVEKLGYDKKKCIDSIKNNKYDSYSGIYYSLLKKSINDNKMSISDLYSEKFLNFIQDYDNWIFPEKILDPLYSDYKINMPKNFFTYHNINSLSNIVSIPEEQHNKESDSEANEFSSRKNDEIIENISDKKIFNKNKIYKNKTENLKKSNNSFNKIKNNNSYNLRKKFNKEKKNLTPKIKILNVKNIFNLNKKNSNNSKNNINSHSIKIYPLTNRHLTPNKIVNNSNENLISIPKKSINKTNLFSNQHSFHKNYTYISSKNIKNHISILKNMYKSKTLNNPAKTNKFIIKKNNSNKNNMEENNLDDKNSKSTNNYSSRELFNSNYESNKIIKNLNDNTISSNVSSQEKILITDKSSYISGSPNINNFYIFPPGVIKKNNTYTIRIKKEKEDENEYCPNILDKNGKYKLIEKIKKDEQNFEKNLQIIDNIKPTQNNFILQDNNIIHEISKKLCKYNKNYNSYDKNFEKLQDCLFEKKSNINEPLLISKNFNLFLQKLKKSLSTNKNLKKQKKNTTLHKPNYHSFVSSTSTKNKNSVLKHIKKNKTNDFSNNKSRNMESEKFITEYSDLSSEKKANYSLDSRTDKKYITINKTNDSINDIYKNSDNDINSTPQLGQKLIGVFNSKPKLTDNESNNTINSFYNDEYFPSFGLCNEIVPKNILNFSFKREKLKIRINVNRRSTNNFNKENPDYFNNNLNSEEKKSFSNTGKNFYKKENDKENIKIDPIDLFCLLNLSFGEIKIRAKNYFKKNGFFIHIKDNSFTAKKENTIFDITFVKIDNSSNVKNIILKPKIKSINFRKDKEILKKFIFNLNNKK